MEHPTNSCGMPAALTKNQPRESHQIHPYHGVGVWLGQGVSLERGV